MPKLNDCLKTHNLLDLIKNRVKNIRKDFVTNPHAQHIESELNFIILCAEKVLNNGWISVDDELPIDEGFVLLLKDDGDIVIGQYVFDTSPFFATTEFYQNQDYDCIADLNDVTHWQPLPQPPKE